MTAPLDEKALAGAHDAFYATESSNSRDMMRNAIRAYLTASHVNEPPKTEHVGGDELNPSPSMEMEVVANLRSDATQLLRMSKATAFGEDLSVRVTKPDLLIATMVAAADTIESLSAQVLRLTEENKALRKERTSLIETKREQIERMQRRLDLHEAAIAFVRRWAVEKEGNGTSAEERLSAIAHHPALKENAL